MKSPINRGGLRFFVVGIAPRGAATPLTILAGIPVIVVGTAIHFWAKGCLRQNRVVATGGAYRFVRHPFYLGNALIDAGLAVMSGWWLLQAVLPVWWLAVYLPVIRSEEHHLLGVFGAIYEDYQKRVPCLVPWRRPLPPAGVPPLGGTSRLKPELQRGTDGFRWSNPNIVADSEIPRVIRILAYPLLFYVCTELRGDGLSFFRDAANLAALACLVLGYAAAWALQRYLARRPRVHAPGTQ